MTGGADGVATNMRPMSPWDVTAMGNASSHDATNLPILVAGGRFKHGSHLAHDPKNPPPLCNLWVQILHEMGVTVPRFGTSSTETLAGFEVA